MIFEDIKLAFKTRKHFRLRVPRLFDVLVVADAGEIRWLNQHADVTRALDPKASIVHRLIHQRLIIDLAFGRDTLPVFRPQSDTARAERQSKLEAQLEDLHGL